MVLGSQEPFFGRGVRQAVRGDHRPQASPQFPFPHGHQVGGTTCNTPSPRPGVSKVLPGKKIYSAKILLKLGTERGCWVL